MSDHGSTKKNATGISSEDVKGEVSEIQTLTQEAVNKQIRRGFASLTRQPEELTRLVPGMITTRRPNHYPRTEFSTTSGTTITQSDMVRGVRGSQHRRQSITSPDTEDGTTHTPSKTDR